MSLCPAKLACEPIEDINQSVHPCSLTRVFYRHSVGSQAGVQHFFRWKTKTDQTVWMRRSIIQLYLVLNTYSNRLGLHYFTLKSDLSRLSLPCSPKE